MPTAACPPAVSVRRRRHRRLLRPGHPGPDHRRSRRRRRRRRWRRCTASPTGWWSPTAASAGTSTPCSPRCSPASRPPARRPRSAGRRSPASASTPGRWTTASSTPPANSSRSRTATGTNAAAPPSPGCTGKLDPARLYATTGLQFLQFNTIYQLATEPDLDGLQALLIPDLIAFLLTGQRRTEATNASTTGLFDAVAGEWATEFLAALGLPEGPVPAADPARGNRRHPAARHRRTDRAARSDAGWWPSARTTPPRPSPPSPPEQENFAYISSGTWSLVGVELNRPVLTEASRAANFTNERGVDGTIRYLRNVGGLWLLSECQRTWAAGRLPARARRTARRGRGAARPADRGSTPTTPRSSPRTTCPTASAPRSATPAPSCRTSPRASSAASWTASPPATPAPSPTPNGSPDVAVDVVHIVGGGSQNRLLCQLTADATGKPVIAGPVEATALGNVLVQARAAGKVSGGLPSCGAWRLHRRASRPSLRSSCARL